MSCSSPDLLSLAEIIAGSPTCDEVSSRCAISRAYYSALHLVDATFPRTDGNIRQEGESSHAVIIREAKLYGERADAGRWEASQVAKTMAGLRRERNRADYKLNQDISRDDALDVIERVKEVVAHCSHVEERRIAVQLAQKK